MLLSLKWLEEFVPYDGTVDALADRLTMLGLEIEEMHRPFPELPQVVTGLVLDVARHPEADRLTVCRVDVGEADPLTIVCGAPNVRAGQTVLAALPGAVLPGGLKIKAAKLRGVMSEGMICAEDELGLGESHAGILVLDEEVGPGLPINQLWPDLDDMVLDVNITPNRADCLSVLGLAREVALGFDLPLTIPDPYAHIGQAAGPEASSLMRVALPEPDLCPCYRGRIVDNIKAGQSPWPLKLRLKAVGQRSVNVVVDVTNYIMFELGQPLHAFDLDRLEGGLIEVRRAGQERVFTTLDSQERKLKPDDLLICDARKPVALAGVMGGENTEFTPQSTRLFLESAVFRPASIRKTARRLALGSEASYRFERGVDQPGSIAAMNKAARMIAALSGGRLLPGAAEAEARPWTPFKMTFRPEKARKYLSLPLTDQFAAKTLVGLGCVLDQSKAEQWQVENPSHRLDLEREVDLIEELGRVYGLDRIPTRLPKVAKSLDSIGQIASEYAFARQIKQWAVGAGLSEVVNYSFVSRRDLALLQQDEKSQVSIINPLSEDQVVLRPLLAPGLLHNLRQNVSQSETRLAVFEVAHTFVASSCSETTAEETPFLGLLLHGPRHPELWPWRRPDQEDYSYADLKGLVEHLLATLRLSGQELTYSPLAERAWLAPGVELAINGRPAGYLGRLRPDIGREYLARRDVWLAELNLDLLAELSGQVRTVFAALPKFPAIKRDITVITPADLPLEALLKVVWSLNMPLLREAVLIDIFTPDNDGSAEQHLTLRFTFRDMERTLTDEEVDRERDRIGQALIKSLGVRV